MKKSDIRAFEKAESMYCNRCRSNTKHSLVISADRNDADLDKDGDWNQVEEWAYGIWKCGGCETIILEERYWTSARPADEPAPWDVTFHPKRARFQISPEHFSQLPVKLGTIYTEALIAFNNDALLLCAIALRTLIEGICVDKEIKAENLYERISGLTRFLPESIVSNLHQLRIMGNEAAHEISAPDEFELRLAIQICESLLDLLYALDHKTHNLKRIRDYKKERDKTKSSET